MGILNIHAIEIFIDKIIKYLLTPLMQDLSCWILNIHAIEFFYRHNNQASAHTTKAGLYHVEILIIHSIEIYIDKIIKYLLTTLRQGFILWES